MNMSERDDVDDDEAQLSEPTLSTAEGGIDEIVARQEEMGQKEVSGGRDDEANPEAS